ncbi:LysR family transcriptional regulator [Methylobacterium sp. ID0610]|uniref:LysR family transcriptional regulator n=1 Tax=Methylobacterium carpenticola TaxID=3344827 RepID=UPI0036B9C489
MSLRALRSLVAIARQGSFARAAETVGLTQSAVSLHVRGLEQEFRAVLFDRSRRRPVLTEAGHVAVARAEEILALYDGLAAELEAGGALAGRLRVGAIQTALAGPVPDALARLRATHPRLRVQVVSGMSAELAVRVDTGELDAAVTTGPVRPHPAGLVTTPLYEEGFWILAPPGLEARGARRILEELPFIRFDRRAWAGRTIAQELRRQRLRVDGDIELDSKEAILRMVTKGLGAAVLPLSEAGRRALPPLTCLPFGDPQSRRAVVLLEREDRPAQRLAAALAEAVREAAAGSASLAHR